MKKTKKAKALPPVTATELQALVVAAEARSAAQRTVLNGLALKFAARDLDSMVRWAAKRGKREAVFYRNGTLMSDQVKELTARGKGAITNVQTAEDILWQAWSAYGVTLRDRGLTVQFRAPSESHAAAHGEMTEMVIRWPAAPAPAGRA